MMLFTIYKYIYTSLTVIIIIVIVIILYICDRAVQVKMERYVLLPKFTLLLLIMGGLIVVINHVKIMHVYTVYHFNFFFRYSIF